MAVMLLGLLLFLGMHSVRIVADDWRQLQIERFGVLAWKLLYSLISIIGLGLAIYGYGLARQEPIDIWMPPMWTQHLVALLMIPAFILLVATYSPASHIRSVLGHPMLLSVALWALGHLLVNGHLGDILFFGAFLVWSLIAFRAARRRNRTSGGAPVAARFRGDVIAVLVGLALYFLFAFQLHVRVIGVPALG
ncbi:NnrU protein [Litchfieldella qijiaojingensis]|uniref:NnrU protein n=1 Tax=Litchfieldella qijiaojingensis TaxID=980347 RepID=A0ABQ2YC13_9GAMM|nr:NnrU family protein [Halomonas qijiaojingensis]GGX77373.1 NnrU protein [Halomonas qijiaojingensis]